MSAKSDLVAAQKHIARLEDLCDQLQHELTRAKQRLDKLEPKLGRTSWVAKCDYDRIVSERDELLDRINRMSK